MAGWPIEPILRSIDRLNKGRLIILDQAALFCIRSPLFCGSHLTDRALMELARFLQVPLKSP
jgi:hypothetical protein